MLLPEQNSKTFFFSSSLMAFLFHVLFIYSVPARSTIRSLLVQMVVVNMDGDEMRWRWWLDDDRLRWLRIQCTNDNSKYLVLRRIVQLRDQACEQQHRDGRELP